MEFERNIECNGVIYGFSYHLVFYLWPDDDDVRGGGGPSLSFYENGLRPFKISLWLFTAIDIKNGGAGGWRTVYARISNV